MSLSYKFRKAEKIIERLSARERETAAELSDEVRQAQKNLLRASRKLMNQCIRGCEGLCCRNAQFDEIIDLWDFVFILLACPSQRTAIAERVENEVPLFTADCLFLKDGVGPCIFPADIRPEVCIATFCADASAVKKEVSQVKRKFVKLSLFIRFRKFIGLLLDAGPG